MIVPAMRFTGLGLVVTVAETVLRYDIRSTCRKAVALTAMAEGGRTVESCVAGEEAARKDVEKDWTKIPAAERTQCVNTVRADRAASYVELLICLEMTRELTQSSGRRAGQVAEACRQEVRDTIECHAAGAR